MTLLTFLFIWIKGGAINGVAKLHILGGCDLGFSLFLSWIEILSYLLMTVIGSFCIWKIRMIYGEDPF